MKKLKHSKYKNTGFLFELLTRQITVDIINGTDSVAEGMLAKYFGKNTELGKELKLYQLIAKENTATESKANRILEAVADTRKRLSERKLKQEKFQLISEIKDNFDIISFFRSPVPNYKLYASIYKVFENVISTELYRPYDVLNAKTTIIESITGEKSASSNGFSPMVESYKKQETDVRMLSYKMLVEQFNKKYKKLSPGQKKLLKEYINNLSNTNSLRKYINEDVVPMMKKALNTFVPQIGDDVTKIKLNETMKQLDKATYGAVVKDNQIASLMLAYELIAELNNVTK